MKKTLGIALALGLLLAGLLGWMLWDRHHRATHLFLGDHAYPLDAAVLDLRGEKLSPAQYRTIQGRMPQCEILWNVPFQERALSSDTQTLTLEKLSLEDVAVLEYLPELTYVDGTGGRDYGALAALQAQKPECQVDYSIFLEGTAYDRAAASLSLSRSSYAELTQALPHFQNLQELHLAEGMLSAQELNNLVEAFPETAISWEKTVMGQTYPQDVKELDFSGMIIESLEALEGDMAYFPQLEKLILCDCGIDDETMAAFRERVRSHYKVVWRTQLGRISIRTDETTFMPRKVHVNMQNHEMENLKYCEDMLVVDVGHMGLVKDLAWLYGMPKLQFLVLVETGVRDLTPIGSLKELIYLELFRSPYVDDYSPLVGCTALENVNLAFTHGDARVFAQMPWLKHLWINQTGVDDETRALLTEALPNTVIEFDHGWHMGNGWRDLDNYYVMRDLLEMPYYAWGSQKNQ